MQERCEFNSCGRRVPWRRAWQPSPVLLPRKSPGSLVGYSPWCHKTRLIRHVIYKHKYKYKYNQISHSVVSNCLWPHGLQHARLPCPSPTPGAYSNSCPSSWWYHPTISSSVIPFSSHLQSFPESGSFLMSQFFAFGGQSTGALVSASALPMNTQDWFPLGLTGLIFLQSKGLSRVFSNNTIKKHQFFSAQLSLQSNYHIHTWLLKKQQLWLHGHLLAK